MPDPSIDELVVAAAPERWSAVGFDVADGRCRVGTVDIRLAGDEAGRGLVSWSLRQADGDLDGLPTERSSRAPLAPGATHPNGVTELDHVVALSPRLERTVPVLERAGLPLRRVREGPTPGGAMRQAFFCLGEVVLEVIEQPGRDGKPVPPDLPARLWGLAFVVESLERTAELLGDRLGEVRDAVQPGRRIATVRRSAGLGAPIAFMSRGP